MSGLDPEWVAVGPDNGLERRKPSDVAWAESEAWQQGIRTARRLMQTHLDERLLLLKLGFPAGHPLCEVLDRGATTWASYEEQMRRDLIAHVRENNLQL